MLPRRLVLSCPVLSRPTVCLSSLTLPSPLFQPLYIRRCAMLSHVPREEARGSVQLHNSIQPHPLSPSLSLFPLFIIAVRVVLMQPSSRLRRLGRRSGPHVPPITLQAASLHHGPYLSPPSCASAVVNLALFRYILPMSWVTLHPQ